MDNFDELLKNKIAREFENFDDGHADKGWTELRKIYPEKANNKRFLIWFPVAAVLVLMCGAAFYFLFRAENNSPLSEETVQVVKNTSPYKDHPGRNRKVEMGIRGAISGTDSVKNYSTNKMTNKPNEYPVTQQNIRPNSSNHTSGYSLVQSETALKSPIKDQEAVQNTSTEPKSETKHSLATKAADTGRDSVYISSDTIASGSNEALNNESDDRKKNLGKKIGEFDLLGSLFLNYARNSTADLNGGIGISKKIVSSKNQRVSLNLGLGISRNYIKSGFSNGKVAFADASAYTNSVSIPASNTSQATNFIADMIGIDIPVKLQVDLGTGKKFYVSAGLNSSLYVREIYGIQSLYYLDTKSSSGGYSGSASTPGRYSFDNYDIGKLGILGFGYRFKQNGKSQFSLEPFWMHTFSGLGQINVKYGTLGFNLKLTLNKKPAEVE